MKLQKNESIVTAFAEYCTGPGWANQLLTVVIRDGNQKVRLEYLQPEEWRKSRELCGLFATSAALNGSVVSALTNLMGR